ncbi:hypothetical protein [Pedobacter jamesrossensis]|uniref:Tryptophan-rich sensory protein n=1 Tax=Pedobacter jamesrossensis TaxID=1908238 RepID=A0ABV8NL83_9SPHI
MKKILPIANGLALSLTIAVNYVSNSGLLNGNTMKTVSDRYFNYFTPAGFAFSIWGLIYLGLLGFVVYTGFNFKNDDSKKNVLTKIGWWFVLSCITNSLWVVAWLYDYTGLSVIIMGVILISLLKIIVNTRMELDAHPLKSYLFIYWPFAIYAGWISVAFVANISAYLTKIDWNGWGISDINWAIIMIGVAGLVNVFMIYSRNLREFALVGIWALFAISVSNSHSDNTNSISNACYVVMVILAIFIVGSGLKNKKRSINSM